MKHYIFCYTGTGNSLKLATDLAHDLGESAIFPIQHTPPPTIDTAKSIGFIFPVFFMDAPQIVQNFIKKINLPNTYIYCVATCGRYAGNSCATIQTLLEKNGHHLNYSTHFIMPDSIPFPELFSSTTKTREKQTSRYASQYEKLQSNIYNQREHPAKWKNPAVSIASHFQTKNLDTFDNAFLVTDDCISCGICVKACGANNITIENEGEHPQFHNHCSSCMACFHYCPKSAITYRKQDQTWFHYTNPNVKLVDRLDFYNQKK